MHRIETTYTEDDMVNLSCFLTFRLDSYRKAIRGKQCALAVIAIMFFVKGFMVSTAGRGGEMFIWICALIIMVSIPFSPRLFRHNMRNHIRKEERKTNGGVKDESMVVELREEGVFCQEVQEEATHFYSDIGEIVEHAGCVYVFVAPNSAIIFPRDRIPSETLDAFVAELKTRVTPFHKPQPG